MLNWAIVTTNVYLNAAVDDCVDNCLTARFKILKCLSAHKYGSVYLVSERNAPQTEPNWLIVKAVFRVTFRDAQKWQACCARFRREFEVASHVRHHSVVEVHEFVEHASVLYFTMDYIQGKDLLSQMDSEKALDVPKLLRLIQRLSEGLLHIHEKQVIHGDLKPENILMDSNGTPKITDFGVSKYKDLTIETSSVGWVGTLDYQSPEFFEDNIISQQGDIYSLGTIAYQIVTGRLPFQGDSLFEVVEQKVKGNPINPHCLNARCPRELSNWIIKAIEKSQTKRFASARDMLSELNVICDKYLPKQIPVEISFSEESVLKLSRLGRDKQGLETPRNRVLHKLSRLIVGDRIKLREPGTLKKVA